MQAPGEGPQLGSGSASEDAVAGQDDRPLGPGDQAGRVLDGLVGRFREVGVSRGERHRRSAAVPRRDVGRGEVFGQLDVGRAGLLEHRDAERLANDLRDRTDPLDPYVPFVTGSNIRTTSTT